MEGLSRLSLSDIDLRVSIRAVLSSAGVRGHHVIWYLEDMEKVNRRTVLRSSLNGVGDGPFGMLGEINWNENSIVGKVAFIRCNIRNSKGLRRVNRGWSWEFALRHNRSWKAR